MWGWTSFSATGKKPKPRSHESWLCTLAQEALAWQSRTGLKGARSCRTRIKTVFVVTSTALDSSGKPFYVLISLKTKFFSTELPKADAGRAPYGTGGFSGGSARSADMFTGQVGGSEGRWDREQVTDFWRIHTFPKRQSGAKLHIVVRNGVSQSVRNEFCH